MRGELHEPRRVGGGSKCGKHSVPFANTPAEVTCKSCLERMHFAKPLPVKREEKKVLAFRPRAV